MWLLMSAVAAICATYAWLKRPGKDRLAPLSMAFWGLTTCVFVDHVLGWEEGDFFEISADAACLGVAMLVSILAVWELALVIDRFRAAAPAAAPEKTEN